MNGYPNFESQLQNQQSHAGINVRNAAASNFESVPSSSATPTSFASNNFSLQSTSSVMPNNGGWNNHPQNHKTRIPISSAGNAILNGHAVSPFSTNAASIGAATAAANLSSLANTSSFSDANESTHSPVTYTHQNNPRHQQQMMYHNTNGSAFSPAVPPNNSHPTYTQNHVQPMENRTTNVSQASLKVIDIHLCSFFYTDSHFVNRLCSDKQLNRD